MTSSRSIFLFEISESPRRCFSRLREPANHGRSVLLVVLMFTMPDQMPLLANGYFCAPGVELRGDAHARVCWGYPCTRRRRSGSCPTARTASVPSRLPSAHPDQEPTHAQARPHPPPVHLYAGTHTLRPCLYSASLSRLEIRAMWCEWVEGTSFFQDEGLVEAGVATSVPLHLLGATPHIHRSCPLSSELLRMA